MVMAMQNLKDFISVSCAKKKKKMEQLLPWSIMAMSILYSISNPNVFFTLENTIASRSPLLFFWNGYFHPWNKTCSNFGNTAENGIISLKIYP